MTETRCQQRKTPRPGDDSSVRLIAAGTDGNAKEETQQSAYLIAEGAGYLDLLELALDHGADVHALDSYNGTGLIRAAERGHATVVDRLLRAGVDVDHVNRLGWAALHEAIVLGDATSRSVDTARLLDARADPSSADRDGVSALDHARSKRHGEIFSVLSGR